MEEFDAIIIGAGASGTMCALSTAKDKRIALIDAMSFPAKKLLVTGNGRCNLTNTNTNSTFYNVNIDNFLNRFNVHQIQVFLVNNFLSDFTKNQTPNAPKGTRETDSLIYCSSEAG